MEDAGKFPGVVRKPLLFAAVCFLMGMSQTLKANSITVNLTSVNGSSAGGVYTDPYYGTLTIDGVTTSVPLVCDDFSHESYIGGSWAVNASSFASLTNARFNTGAVSTNYEEAGWLALQLLNPANATNYNGISYALWGIFDTSLSSDATYSSVDAGYWLALAEGAVGSPSFNPSILSDLLILTPQDNSSGSPQEFITVSQSGMPFTSPNPEPNTWLLMATGLLLVIGVVWRNRRIALS